MSYVNMDIKRLCYTGKVDLLTSSTSTNEEMDIKTLNYTDKVDLLTSSTKRSSIH